MPWVVMLAGLATVAAVLYACLCLWILASHPNSKNEAELARDGARYEARWDSRPLSTEYSEHPVIETPNVPMLVK